MSKQQGSAHMLVVALVAVGVILTSASFYTITKQYSDGKSNVAGVQSDDKKEVSVLTDSGQTAFTVGITGALTEFPVKLDSKTNQVVVQVAGQPRAVPVLPDEAIRNTLAAKVMSYLTSFEGKGVLASINSLVKQEERQGVLGYQIKGVKKHTFLGFIPAKTQVKAFVSAENGQVVETQQSLLGRVLNRIAP